METERCHYVRIVLCLWLTMAQSKSHSKKSKSKAITAGRAASSKRATPSQLSWKLFGCLFLVAVLAVAVAVVYIPRQNQINTLTAKTNRQDRLMSMSNQACMGLTASKTTPPPSITNLVATQTVQDGAYGTVATFSCTIGQNTKPAVAGKEVAEVDKKGIEMGATVMYFESTGQADKYHQQVINPLRYWGVPNGDLTDNVPSFKYFVSYVFGNPVYFDAYAIKGNAIVRITLPCGSTDTDAAKVDTCIGASVGSGFAIAKLKAFVESIAPFKP